MAETHVLTTPVTFPTPSSITGWEVIRFFIDKSGSIPWILLVARSNTGKVVEARYESAAATTLLSQLNTVNLTVKSLQKRILERMAADGFLDAGAVTGTPD